MELLFPLLITLSLIIIAATLLPLFRVGEWWIRIFDFPRLQIFSLGVILAVPLGYLAFQRMHAVGQTVFVVLLGCIIYEGFKMAPYTRLRSKQSLDSLDPPHEKLLRIMTANVYMDNREASEFLTLISTYAPDVLLVLEADHWWEEQLKGIETTYTYFKKHPLENTYGLLLYSRLKFHDAEIRFIIEDAVPSVFAKIELPSGDVVDFYGLHPRPPAYGQDTEERDAELLIIGRLAAQAQNPVVVTGDLNDVAWSYTTTLFQRISGLVDPRVGRGFYNTFHAKYPLLRFPVDHIFHSRSFRLVEMRRLEPFGSDHFAMLAVLAYQPELHSAPAPAPATREDRQEAQEMIQEGKEKES